MKKRILPWRRRRSSLNDEIHSRTRTNVVETKRFSERLEMAIARYHTNAIITVGSAARADQPRQRGAGSAQAWRGRRPVTDEIAFYDALAENSSAVEVKGDTSLKIIAHELLVSLKAGVTVDWSPQGERKSANARAREADPPQARVSAGPQDARFRRPEAGGNADSGLVA